MRVRVKRVSAELKTIGNSRRLALRLTERRQVYRVCVAAEKGLVQEKINLRLGMQSLDRYVEECRSSFEEKWRIYEKQLE